MKYRILKLLICLLLMPCACLWAQPQWQWEELAPMPQAISNNAVTAAKLNGKTYVYSFGGIGPGLQYSDISLASFRYEVENDQWQSLPDLPDTLGKIAAAASTVKGKIYIIGGYHVFANSNEKSSDRVHVFDPASNTYLPDGAPVPVPIDDQVQAVWRDSLIYVVSGWSNSVNVNNVQVYDPSANSWMAGTPLPNTTDYKVFGASGCIIEDTIYYMGGARMGSNFPLTSVFRKGVIQPNEPDSIAWTSVTDPAALGYRMASVCADSKAYWLGGSLVSYNYDAIAYNGSGTVQPSGRIAVYNSEEGALAVSPDTIFPLMDLREAGKIDDTHFILAGGILKDRVVSNKTFLLRYGYLAGIDKGGEAVKIEVFPNPAKDILIVRPADMEVDGIELINMSGKRLEVNSRRLSGGLFIVDLKSISAGNYIMALRSGTLVYTKKITVSE